jgi:hypothetical protein
VLGLVPLPHVASHRENPTPQAVNLVLVLALAVSPVWAVSLRSRWSPAETKSLMVAITRALLVGFGGQRGERPSHDARTPLALRLARYCTLTPSSRRTHA